MQRGISYWSFENGLQGTHPIQDAIQEAEQVGFEALELCIGKTGELSVTTTEKECAEIRALIDTSELVVESVASGMSWDFCPTHPDAAIRYEAINLHKAALERCAWLGCKSLLFVPGAIHIPWNPDFPGVPYELAVRYVSEAVRALLPVAEACHVDICLENVWNGLFYSPLELRSFIDSFESPWVKVYFDVGNVLGYHQDPADWIKTLGRRIGRVHVKDFKRAIGNMDGFCDLGEGDVPWAKVTAALQGIGYSQTVIAEMMPWRPDLLEKTATAIKSLIPA